MGITMEGTIHEIFPFIVPVQMLKKIVSKPLALCKYPLRT